MGRAKGKQLDEINATESATAVSMPARGFFIECGLLPVGKYTCSILTKADFRSIIAEREVLRTWKKLWSLLGANCLAGRDLASFS